MHKVKNWLLHNSVLLLFVVLCIIGIILSRQPVAFVLDELVARVARNSFLVLALIIPIIAGMGLNFGIVMGAMAGQIALIAVTDWGIVGLPGFLLAVAISTPFAILFGYFTGLLFNKTKGQEMITGMIAGYFSSGLYQLLFLFIMGGIIPMKTASLVVSGGVGIKNTLDLSEGVKYALDSIWKLPLSTFVLCLLIIIIGFEVCVVVYTWMKHKKLDKIRIIKVIACLVGVGILQIKSINDTFAYATVPVITMLIILLLCGFNWFIMRTKLGKDFRTIGQNIRVANAAGINVDKVRIKAIIISTILAAWGQLIFLQNIGTLNTYGSHEQVGMFASAAILIGGASITKATNKQALMGVMLFHTLFIVSPQAGQNLFNNAQIGEYFRVFVAYAVICIALALYAWKYSKTPKKTT